MTTFICPKCQRHWVMGPTRDIETLECAFCLRKSYDHLLSERDTLLREAEEISEAEGESYSGSSPTDPGPDPHQFDLYHLRARNAELESCLEAMIPLMELAFAAEGDTFGIEHNHATDVLIEAERLVANR